MSMHLYVKSQPTGIMAAWLKAGRNAGLILGGVYAGILGAFTGSAGGIMFSVLIGCIIGTAVGIYAATINSIFLSLLARPLALRPGSRLARLRAAIITVVVTEAALLPVQLLFPLLPIGAILLPTIPSLLAAAIVATRIAPAGQVAAAPDAMVRIQAR